MKTLTRRPVPEGKKTADKMDPRFVFPMVLFYLLAGALMVWLKGQVTAVASYVLAGLLIIYGVYLAVRYIRSSVAERIAGKDLAFGLILLLSGIILAVSPSSLEEILPAVWGLSLVFGGFLKIQYAFDEKTVGIKRWWIMLAFAAVSLLIGTLALLGGKVFTGGNDQTLFIIGIFMIAEAVLDAVTCFLISRALKKLAAPAQPAPAPAQPEPGQPESARPEGAFPAPAPADPAPLAPAGKDE